MHEGDFTLAMDKESSPVLFWLGEWRTEQFCAVKFLPKAIFPWAIFHESNFALVDFFPSVRNPLMAYQIKPYTIKSFHQLFFYLVIAR